MKKQDDFSAWGGTECSRDHRLTEVRKGAAEQMKKGNRISRYLIPACLVLCLLSGCEAIDTQDSSATGSQDSLQTGQRGKLSGQIEEGEHEAITICTANVNYTYFLEALHEKYPEINLEFISYKGCNTSGYMKEELENGDIPDIYSSTYMQDEELQEKYLLNLSTYDFINNYTDSLLDDVEVNGEVYMVPSSYTVAGINYNKTMFEEHGWKVPESFEELKTLVAQIKEEAPDVTPVAARMDLKGYPFQYLFALGSTEFLGTVEGTKWKTDFLAGNETAVGNIESSASYLKEWIDEGYITDDDINGSDLMSDFYDGKIAMVLGIGTSGWSGVGKTTGEVMEVGIMAWPGENGNHGMLLSDVSRYYGISKQLAEVGNEQKLEDALKVLEFISTDEGQQALSSGSTTGVVFPFENYEIDENSPLYEVKDYIDQGYTVPVTYGKWVDHLLVPMADELIEMVQGKIDVKELLIGFDRINRTVQENPESYDYAELDEDLSQVQAARLVGMAMIEDTGADAALVSLGGITDDGNYLENPDGVQCGIYAGGISEETINIFRPSGTKMTVMDLTGDEISAMTDAGRELLADPDEAGTEYSYLSNPVTYYMPYVLVTKDDAELSGEETYRVVFSEGDYSDSAAEKFSGRMTVLADESPADALIAWFEKLQDGHFDASDLQW
jgi:raffinose/stachyose/melibiose transport system substrate-binding protein